MSQNFLISQSIADLEINHSVKLDQTEWHHIKNVLRLQSGDQIRLIDGRGGVCVTQIDNDNLTVVSTKIFPRRSPKITLFQSLPKSDKMERIIQKTTEIGVDCVIPLISERTVVKLKNVDRKIERWQRIADEAMKQCGRKWRVEIGSPVSFNESLTKLSQFDLPILFWENETEKSFNDLIKPTPCETVAIFVGPEGGFSEVEADQAISFGCQTVSLGENILRTETAAIIGVAITIHEFRFLW